MEEAANMKTVQTVLFVILMAGASWWDIRKRIFPDHYVLLLFLAALISFDPWKLTGILAAFPFLVTALWIGGVGGGDIKFVADWYWDLEERVLLCFWGSAFCSCFMEQAQQ